MAKKNILERPLVRMLACLDDKQHKGFHEYLNCKLFNTNPTLVRLYTYLESKALLAAPEQLLESEMIVALDISASTGAKLFSQLLSLLNRFVAFWETKDDKTSELAPTLAGWHRMGLPADLLERKYQKMKRKLPASPRANYDLLYELELETSYAGFKVNQARKGEWEFFDRHFHLLDSFYQITRLKYLCAAKSAGQVFQHSNDPNHDLTLTVGPTDLPLIGQGYATAFQLLNADPPSVVQVRLFFTFLETHGKAFDSSERGDLYGYLLNCCFRATAKVQEGAEELIHEIYDAMLGHGLLTELGYIIPGHFKNIVSIKTRLGLNEEAKAFIKKNQSKLKAEIRPSLVPFTHGIVAFYAGEFRQAIQEFRTMWQSSTDDLMWTLEARKMHWKSYFEIYDQLTAEEYEEMLRIYHSFRVYVSRNSRISGYHKEGYENFIRMFNQLIRTGEEKPWESTLPELKSLHTEVVEIENVVHKKWLLKAIEKVILKKDNS